MIQDNITFDLPVNFGIPFESSQDIYGGENVETFPVEVNGVTYDVVSWGRENQLPYQVKKKIGANGVMAQNKYFNMLTSYGRGLEYIDIATINDKKPLPTRDADIRKFLLRNSMKEFFAEQIVDMKYYFFAVSVVILDRQRKNIVKIVHKEACHCRFEKADESGHIKHVFFADWENSNAPKHIEAISMLDEKDPFGDLAARTGKEPDPLGIFKPDSPKLTKYAIVCKIPTVGSKYYPIPPSAASFKDGWYDIYGLLTQAKKAKIKNGQNIRYHVEISTEFWEDRARKKGITFGSKEYYEMQDDYIKEFKAYLGGSKNSDKMLWSEFKSMLDGKEQHYIKVNVIDTSKAGSEYNDDVAEASNVLCYGDNVHPNLAGAVPGKSQMNNSGSDKRELFTMKQALETLPHDMMMKVHNTIIWFNGWEDKVEPLVPMILLTTLDKKTDAVESNTNNQTGEGNNGN